MLAGCVSFHGKNYSKQGCANLSIEFLESDYDKASCLVNLLSVRASGLAADDFVIVLYTACDHGRGAHESQVRQKNRARQNGVFEHGYLMAKLGREMFAR
ncbi:TIR domain-containing protein [Billgrantia sp. C5P2]|uniref:TIR domain-containing protein n=1 Tax=Billgrantia sp. C5P2 TaxID=3436239 RepID=UPI003DA304F8